MIFPQRYRNFLSIGIGTGIFLSGVFSFLLRGEEEIVPHGNEITPFQTGGQGEGKVNSPQSLNITFNDEATAMTVVSPPFAVRPFHVYEVIWDAQFDHRGMQLLPGLRISSEDKGTSETNFIDISATRNPAADSYALAIPPQVHQASLTLQLTRSSPLTGRSVNINHFALRDLGPLNNQSDGEWFFNGSFDLIDTWPPPNWKTFGSAQGKFVSCTESPFDGSRCLRAVACDHIVFPSIQVKDRDVLHIRFQIRGEEGGVGVTAHHLDDSGRERLGGMTLVFPQKNLSLHSGKWQSVDLLVAALYPTRYIQVVISSQKKTLDLDAIEVRRVGPDFPWRSPVSENPSY